MVSFLSGCVFLLVVSAAYVRGYRFFIQVKDDVRNNPPPARPTLQLAEVQFFYSNQPIPSSTFTAISSSLDGDGLGSLFDNNTMSFASTNNSSDPFPFLLVDLSNVKFDRVVIYQRVDKCCRSWIEDFSFQIIADKAPSSDSSSESGVEITERKWILELSPDIVFLKYTIDFELSDEGQLSNFAVVGSNYLSSGQAEQDRFVISYFQEMRGGTYIDIGANDGVTFSNTYILDKHFGWSGLLVEPQRDHLPSLLANRSRDNFLVNACVYNKTYMTKFIQVRSSSIWKESHGFGEDMLSGNADAWRWTGAIMDHAYTETSVPCFHVQELLRAYNLTHVDYLSIDAEGADKEIVYAIDWTVFSATVVSLEPHDDAEANELHRFFMGLGFKHWVIAGHDLIFFK